MVTTAVPGGRPHEVRPARGNTTCGWLPGGFYAGSPISCTQWISPDAGEGYAAMSQAGRFESFPFDHSRQSR